MNNKNKDVHMCNSTNLLDTMLLYYTKVKKQICVLYIYEQPTN